MSGGQPRARSAPSVTPLRRAGRMAGAVAARGIRGRLAALEAGSAELARSQDGVAMGLSEAIDRLDKQMNRSGRELFKANALAESQQKSQQEMLEQLRDAAAYRERELAKLREGLADATDSGRLDVVRRLLPALDGLEEALASGRRHLQRAADRDAADSGAAFWQRLNPLGRGVRAATSSNAQALAAWVEGLSFVQERLLEAMAAVGVTPVPTQGQVFDPNIHVVVETVPASAQTAPGTIVREHRRGYRKAGEILRYAEVVVSR